MSVLENNFGQFESARESATANAWSQSAFAEIMSDRLYSSGARKVDDPNWLGNLVLEDNSKQSNVAQAENSAEPNTETNAESSPEPKAEPTAEPNAVASTSGESSDGPKVAHAVGPAENGPGVVEGPGPTSSGDARAKGRVTYQKPGDDTGLPKTLPGTPEGEATSEPRTRIPFEFEPTETPKEKSISERVKNAMDEVKQRHVAGEGAFGKAFHFPTEEEQQARDIEKMKNALAEVAKRRPPHDPNEPIKESPFKKRIPAENPNPNPGNETPSETPQETPTETPPATPVEIPAEPPAETPVEPPATPPEEPPHETPPSEQPPGYESETPILNG